MAILIDDTMATMFFTTPGREGWLDDTSDVRVVAGLRAADVTEDDVALLPAPEATRLVRTHVIDRSLAVVHDGIGMISMWTPVRADEIDEAIIYLRGVSASGETLVRALMKPFFGIEATELRHVEEPPEDARVVVSEGAAALEGSQDGFREDLARSWFIMTGKPYVSHVTVVGVRALARDADAQLAVLRRAVDTGWERRRDVRRTVREATNVDADTLAEVTGRMRLALEPEDQEPLRMLVERGTWGTDYGRSLPAFRDQLGLTANTEDVDRD